MDDYAEHRSYDRDVDDACEAVWASDEQRAAARAARRELERQQAEVHAMAELGRQWIVTQYGVGA